VQKPKYLVSGAIAQKSARLVELQQMTGYLNFVIVVVPLGQTFPRRLYNMEVHFPRGGRYQRRRLSSEAKKDLVWWAAVLTRMPKRSIAIQVRETISVWSDASSTKGLSAFYTSQSQPQPQLHCAFAISISPNPSERNEHINTQERRAVEQALLYWGPIWKGKRVLLHTENRMVAYGIAKGTSRGGPMQVLQRCLLLATANDSELEARWISTKENVLANALSRPDYNRITDLAPQLIYPAANLQEPGSRIFSKHGSPPPLTTPVGRALCLQLDETIIRLEPASPYSVLWPTTSTKTADVSLPK